MNMRLRNLTAAAVFLLAGCASGSTSSGSGSMPPKPTAPAPSVAHGTGVLTVTFTIPSVATRPKNGRRAPRYISPSTSSVTVAVDGGSVTTAPSTCTSGTCTIALILSDGVHTLAFRLWDAPNGGGNELASNLAASCPVTAGAVNTCPIIMYGLARSLQMTTASANVTGSQMAGYTYSSSSSAPFTIDALDADGNEMLGVGAITPTVSTTGREIDIATPAPSAPPVYTIVDTNAMPQTISISTTPAPNSDGTALATNVTIMGNLLSCAQNAIVGQGVPLGSAAAYAVLAASTVTNTGATTVTGDVGVSPGTALTGFPPGIVVSGALHADDPSATQAQLDLATAYNNAAGRTNPASLSGEIGGLIIPPGVYVAPGALAIDGNVTLDGQNDSNSVFIFQSATTLVTSADSTITLINGADPCNVFWQVGTSADIGANSAFFGSILAQVTITAGTGATVHGRMLAETGAVTLEGNTVTKPRP